MKMMNRKLCLAILFVSSGLMFAAQTEPASGFVDPQSAQKTNTREEELYSAATNVLNDGQYGQAATDFAQVAAMRGRRADAALYWKAYALSRASNKAEALAAVEELKKNYPQSRWIKDANALAMEIRTASGQAVDPENVSDEELKLIAINSLMQTEPEKALPILEKVLQGNASFNIKDKALFVLSQNRSEKAQQLLLSIAKGSNQPELQSKAIKWLAISGGKNNQALRDIYLASTSPEVKHQVLKSFIMNGDKETLLAIIRQEKSPELRREGIKQLGPMGARAELRQLYKEANDTETKEALLQAMGVAGASQDLIEIAKTETDPEIRSRAIRNVGVFGGEGAIPALTSIYSSSADIETKKQVIRALFVHGAAKEMVALARKETNPELKRELMRHLSIMHSPDATDYMMEILNK